MKRLRLFVILAFAGAVFGATVGPDNYGYTATDATAFNFIDISGTGTRVLAGEDDSTVVVAIGFLFNFYGTNYGTVCFSSNGLLVFSGCNSAFVNEDLRNSNLTVNLPSIAVLWDDWEFFSGGTDAVYFVQVVGSPGSRQLIIQWNLASGFFNSPRRVIFEVILYEGTNNILLQYKDVNSGDFRAFGASATVGVRDTNGDTNGRHLLWSFNQGVISNGQAILISKTAAGIPLTQHIIPGLFGHHPTHRHHGQHGHTQPDYGTPPHIPGHSAGLTAAEDEGLAAAEPQMVVGANEDGSLNGNTPAVTMTGLPGRLARRGSVVQIFTPASLVSGGRAEAWINGLPAEVVFSGAAPGQPGVWQFNVRIPANAPTGLDVPVSLAVGGQPLSHQASVAIR